MLSVTLNAADRAIGKRSFSTISTSDRTRISTKRPGKFPDCCALPATLSASLLNSFANGECFAQRSLPARAKLFGGFGVRHEEIESVEGAR